MLVPEDDFFKNLNRLIIANINNVRYTLDHLSQDCHLSRSQLHRKIKDEVGLSTSLYIRKIKLLKAKELISQLDKSRHMSEIAYSCGFSSPQTLSRYFSAAFGSSPTQFRQELLDKRVVKAQSFKTKNTQQEPSHDEAHQLSDLDAHTEDTLPSVNPSPDFSDSSTNEAGSEMKRSEMLSHAETLTGTSQSTTDQKSRMVQATEAAKISNAKLKPLERLVQSKSAILSLVGLAILSAIAVTTVSQYWGQSDSKGLLHKKPIVTDYDNSVAVLPFNGIGGGETETFSAGIQEDILTKLAFFQDLKVISRTSTETFKNTTQSIKEIALTLGVAYVLEGSVRIQGHQVAVTTQLIRASDDAHVWAENYIRDIDDVFKIQDEIALKVATILNQKISAETKAQINDGYKPGKEALKNYLIGKELIKERTHSSLLASISHLDEALAKEPDFIDALVLKANAYQLLGNIGYDRSNEYSANAENSVLLALRKDHDNPKAHAILACIYRDAHKWEQAAITFETALDYAPNDPLNNYWYSLLLREIGKLDQAIIYSRKARELDPLYPVIHGGHIVNLAYHGQHQEAADVIEEGEVLFSQSFIHHWAKAVYFETIEDHQSAIASFEKVLQINPELQSAHHGILFNRARLGHTEEVLDYLKAIRTNAADDLITKALLYAGLKDADQSAELMLEAMERGAYPSDILVDQNYDFMRDHKKYRKILNQYNLSLFGGLRQSNPNLVDADGDGLADEIDRCPSQLDVALSFHSRGDMTGNQSDFVSIPYHAALDFSDRNFAFSAWVYPLSGVYQTILSKGDGGPNATNYIFQIVDQSDTLVGSTGGMGLFLCSEEKIYEWQFSNSRIPKNSWSQVAVSVQFENNIPTATFFLNGKADGKKSFQKVTAPLYTEGDHPLYIGRQGDRCACNHMNGRIDELMIWDKSITATDLTDSYTGTEADLIAYYDFDDSPACRLNSEVVQLTDKANQHHGSLVNFQFYDTCESNWAGGHNQKPCLQ